MMTQDEFIKRVNGKPWVDRAVTLDKMDCYGLVLLYYKHVLGIELPVPTGYYEKEKMENCWTEQRGTEKWEEIKRPAESGLLFTAYHGKIPMHVGVMIDKFRAIHCRGGVNETGKVEIHKISAIERLYGKVTYHKYIG